MALGVEGVRVGMWTDPEHRTGCTVVLPPAGSVGGIAVRGGAPGTREAAVLGPAAPNEACHAVVLCGSSLFGLRAADGVVDWCEAAGHRARAGGRPVSHCGRGRGVRHPQPGHAPHRPRGRLGRLRGGDGGRARQRLGGRRRRAAPSARRPGLEWASKGGQGSAVRRSGGLAVGALMAVNALGSVLRERTGGCSPAAARRPMCRAIPTERRRPASPAPSSAASQPMPGCGSRKPAGSPTSPIPASRGRYPPPIPAWTATPSSPSQPERSMPVSTSISELAAQAVADAIREAVRHARGIPGFPADPRARRVRLTRVSHARQYLRCRLPFSTS